MTKQEQIEEIKQVLIKTCKRCRPSEEDYMQSNYAEALYAAGYRKVGEYKAEIAKLKSEVNDYKQRYESSEKRYFELTQSGCEALRAKDEHFKKKVRKILGTVAKIMIEQFGDEPPCNFNDNDDYMYENCEEFCCEYCNTPDNEKKCERCWVEFLKSKMKKYGEVEE